MSRKRKHGTNTTPITFSSAYGIELRLLKQKGINMSEFIDNALRLSFMHGSEWTASGWPRAAAYEGARSVIEAWAEMDFEQFIMRRAFGLANSEGSGWEDWTVYRPGDEEE